MLEFIGSIDEVLPLLLGVSIMWKVPDAPESLAPNSTKSINGANNGNKRRMMTVRAVSETSN